MFEDDAYCKFEESYNIHSFTDEEEINSHSPPPESKVSTSSRLNVGQAAAERASSQESDQSEQTPNYPQAAEPEEKQAASQEVESEKSDAG